jgi:DNA-binding CsgD family transcriptional regulator
MARGAWAEAHAAFAQAVAANESPQGLEMLGLAAFWMEDADACIAARERAFRLYRAGGDRFGAARAAITLADDYFTFRDQKQIAGGWLLRARRLLGGLESSPEHGWLACQSGYLALMGDHDTAAAGRFGAEATARGRALGVVDIEMFGLALEGLTLVGKGEIAAGMARLDEAAAAATSGEVADPSVAGTICCTLIFACEWVRDYPRAAEWCERVKVLCEQWQISSLLGVCRAHYAGVLIWQGAWPEAERELAASSAVLGNMRPALAAEATVRLGELRRRQGRWAESSELFERATAHPQSLLGKAALALDRGDAQAAREWAERYLRRLPAESRPERAPGLELLVRSGLAGGDLAGARSAGEELHSIALETATAPLRALAATAEGLLAFAAGELTRSRQLLEDSADLFERSGAPFEAATARLDLARILDALGRPGEAARERAHAETAFRGLGRSPEATGPASPGPPPALAPNPAGLTSRENEVVGLIANGLSNHEIAAELVLSLRTVERHISTIYEKLGARGKAARAAAGVYAVRHGLA